MRSIDRIGSIFLRQVLRRMKQLGLNQSALAKRMNVSRPYITKVLKSDVNISFGTAAKLARALEMDFFPQLNARETVASNQTTQQSDSYSYDVLPGDLLTDDDCRELSRVFSRNYGIWSRQAPAPMKPGARIRMSPARYRDWYAKRDFKIARCFAEGLLIGQAIYLDVKTSRGHVAFVVQLVVDEAHRHRGIAKSMLHAAFGFSDYYAWAIVTSSPCTVSALESATFRRGNLKRIAREVGFIRSEIFGRIGFLKGIEPQVTSAASLVNSGFFTDRSLAQPDPTDVRSRYGELPEGHEWLAVVFQDQDPDCLDSLEQLIACSGQVVAKAYARMPQGRQPWAGRADDEIAAILAEMSDLPRTARIGDFGAGSGRHLQALKKAGFHSATGIDFAPGAEALAAGVVRADCRTWQAPSGFDLILCLYDVIGSFPSSAENGRILSNIVKNLAAGGRVVLSVANRDYVAKKNMHPVDASDRSAFLKAVFRLKPSNAMSTDGEFFEHDSLFDEKTGLFYHKEQFKDTSGDLPAEYLVVDQRYSLEDIVGLVRASGLTVEKSRYVRAGFAKAFQKTTGKEILLICQQANHRRKL